MKQQLLTIGIFICGMMFYAFVNEPSDAESKSYEQLFLVTRNDNLDYVFKSIDGASYERSKLARQSQGTWDLNPLLNMIDQYEREGWVLMSTPGNMGEYNLFWLRREKK